MLYYPFVSITNFLNCNLMRAVSDGRQEIMLGTVVNLEEAGRRNFSAVQKAVNCHLLVMQNYIAN